MLPNFLVIGAQKCGTTALCEMLAAHPDVFISEPKEPHFFAKDEVYSRGMEWYQDLFTGSESAKAVGEGSTGYTMHTLFPNAPARIYRHLPDIRLIYIVRHPVARIESAIMQRLGDGKRTVEVSRMLKEYPRILDACRYWKQIGFYRQFYPDEKIKVVFHEDLVSNPRLVLCQLFGFIGVSTEFSGEMNVKNSNVSNEKNAPIYSVAQMRRSSLAVFARRYFPEAIYDSGRDAYRWILQKSSRSIKRRPVLDPASHEYVVSELSEDVSRFLFHYGKPVDFWDLSLPCRDR